MGISDGKLILKFTFNSGIFLISYFYTATTCNIAEVCTKRVYADKDANLCTR